LASGLVVEVDEAIRTRGRPAQALRLHTEAGRLLAVELGATSISVGVTDLAGDLLDSVVEPADIADGPEAVLGRVQEMADDLLDNEVASRAPLWGAGIGLPGPVEYATGHPIAPPIMPGWGSYPVRERFARRYGVPVWVDNDVNLMAIGEVRAGLARGTRDVLFVKIGTGIGAGLISDGRLHRGAQGVAGDIGHVAVAGSDVVCRCGNTGCLEAVAGGAALAKVALDAARSGQSRFLEQRLEDRGDLQASDLGDAALRGDPVAVEAFGRSGEQIGRILATLINFFNPGLVVIGGGVAQVGDLLLAAIRQTVYRRSLPLATRDLRVVRTGMADDVGLRGAAFVVADELFSRARLPLWLASGSPVGQPELTDDPA
jgi:glucokinase-like ROK family protein